MNFQASHVLPVVFASVLVANQARGQHFDIFVTDLGTQTGIGAADVDGGVFDVGTRVFEGVMIASGAPDYSRNEPGFFALSNLAPGELFPSGTSALPANTPVSLSFGPFSFNGNTSSLFHWDGVGAVDFQPAAGISVALSDGIESTGGNGELDFHPDFQIDDPLGTAANGVYLASLTATAAGRDPSDPVFLVWLVDSSITNDVIAEEVEEQIEAGLAFQFFETAVEHVESSLVPEPATTTVALLGLSVMLVGQRYRRNPA
jgi:hypothetical protein